MNELVEIHVDDTLVGRGGLSAECVVRLEDHMCLLEELCEAPVILLYADGIGSPWGQLFSDGVTRAQVAQCRAMAERGADEVIGDSGVLVEPLQSSRHRPLGVICLLGDKKHAWGQEVLAPFGKIARRIEKVLQDGGRSAVKTKGQALEELKLCYKTIFNGVSDGMLLINADTSVVLGQNDAFSSLTGMSDLNQLSDIEEMFIIGDHYDALEGYVQTWGIDKEIPPVKALIEHIDGAMKEVEIRTSLIVFDGIPILQLVFHDQTSAKRLERHIRDSQSMNTLGLIISGMSHDFNEHLNSVGIALDLLASQSGTFDEVSRHCVELMSRSMGRLNQLTRYMKSMGGNCKPASSVIDLHQLMDEIQFLLPYTLGENVALSLQTGAEDHLVCGDTSQIQCALMNLCLNADHAMPDGGTLHIETRNVTLKEKNARVGRFLLDTGKYLQIEVKDTGCGIDPDIAQRVFQPCFSTKAGGVRPASGLGLATVHKIMERHHGAVTFKSTPGRGSSFSLFLPLESSSMGGQRAVHEVRDGGDGILLCI